MRFAFFGDVVGRSGRDGLAGAGIAAAVVARRGDHTFQVHDGAALAAGDRVRFVVVPDKARYLLIASIDGSGLHQSRAL